MFLSWGKQRILIYNDAYSQILGIKHPDALGEKFNDVWKEIWTDIEPLVLRVDLGESIYLKNLKLILNRHGFDEETYFTFSYSPLLGESGQPEGLFCSCVETTKEVFAERNLLESKLIAERANLAKGQFLANISHEIRTPLAAIMGYLGLLKSPELSKKDLNDFIGTIERSSKQLLYIVNDILDLSKIEAGEFSIDNNPFNLIELLNDFNSLMSLKATEKGLDYKFEITTKIPDILIGDSTRFRQIISNLVGNAIKFTEKGYVHFKISFNHNILNCSIIDTGPGIDDKLKTRLYEPFSLGDNTITRNQGGTGLGLHLTKRLSKAMNGKVYLEQSALDKGTIFTVELPFETPSDINLQKNLDSVPKKNNPPKVKSLHNLKILIIEDTKENQRLLKLILEGWGAITALASDGKEGFTKAMSSDFDFVLMDIQMPVMDGYEATRLLRANGFQKPIIALTAHAMKEEKQKCLEIGFSKFLSKPIDLEKLYKLLARN